MNKQTQTKTTIVSELPAQVTFSLELANLAGKRTGLMYPLIIKDGEHMRRHDKLHHSHHMLANDKHQAINDPGR